eukprot:7719422-Pyramimonas_sp.AAC.1
MTCASTAHFARRAAGGGPGVFFSIGTVESTLLPVQRGAASVVARGNQSRNSAQWHDHCWLFRGDHLCASATARSSAQGSRR